MARWDQAEPLHSQVSFRDAFVALRPPKTTAHWRLLSQTMAGAERAEGPLRSVSQEAPLQATTSLRAVVPRRPPRAITRRETGSNAAAWLVRAPG